MIELLKPYTPELNESKKQDTEAIHLYGVDDYITSIGKCCRPIPGDAIVGLVSTGDGIAIHHEIALTQDTLAKRLKKYFRQAGTSIANNYLPFDCALRVKIEHSYFQISHNL